MTIKDEYFTISESAKYLGVTRQTISRWIAEGTLSAERIGRERLIPKQRVAQLNKGFGLVGSFLWPLQEFLGYHPQKVTIEGYEHQEKPLRVTVVDNKGKTELVEMTRKKYIRGKIMKFDFRRVKRFSDTANEGVKIQTEIRIGIDKDGNVARTVYTDFRDTQTRNKNKEMPERARTFFG